jgi:hypothetical protein
MNGTSRTNPEFDPDDGRLDPNLARLFDDAQAPPQAEAFVSEALARLESARRARLIRRYAALVVVMVAGAFLAPYAASASVAAASWLAERLPDTVLALGSCACAALLAWRAHRQFG